MATGAEAQAEVYANRDEEHDDRRDEAEQEAHHAVILLNGGRASLLRSPAAARRAGSSTTHVRPYVPRKAWKRQSLRTLGVCSSLVGHPACSRGVRLGRPDRWQAQPARSSARADIHEERIMTRHTALTVLAVVVTAGALTTLSAQSQGNRYSATLVPGQRTRLCPRQGRAPSHSTSTRPPARSVTSCRIRDWWTCVSPISISKSPRSTAGSPVAVQDDHEPGAHAWEDAGAQWGAVR